MLRRAIAFAICGVFALSLVSCTSQTSGKGTEAGTVTVALGEGGELAPAGFGVRLDVPKGSAPSGTKVSFSFATTSAPPSWTRQVGQSIQISPTAELPGAQLRFPFDPSRDLPGAGATTGNAYLAVYNSVWRSWTPLPTRYDPARKQLVAKAPHFSVFGAFSSVPGATAVWNVGKRTVSTVVKVGQTGVEMAIAGAEAVWDAVRPQFGVRAKDPGSGANDPCKTHFDDRWAVTSTSADVTGCVADPEGPDEPKLVVHNQWQFPMDVRPSSTEASTGLNDGDSELSIGGLVMRYLNAAVKGWGLVGGPGTTWVGPPENFAASGQPLSVDLEANWLGLALDVIDTSLAIVPDWEVAETRVRVEFQAVLRDVQTGAVHVTSFEQALTIVVQRLRVDKGDDIEAAEKVVSGALCLTKLVGGAVTATKIDGKKITTAVAECLRDLLADAGRGLVKKAAEFDDYLEGLSGYLTLPTVINDFREHGRQSVTLTASRQLTAAEADALPATPLSIENGHCPSAPAGPPVAGAPDRVDCLWLLNLDMDGNGKADRLAVWTKGSTRGAVVYLDDRTYHELEPVRRDNAALRDPDKFSPLRVLSMTGDDRQQAQIALAYGSSTRWTALLAVDHDHRLRFVTKDGLEEDLPDGQAAAYGSGFGCITVDGRPAFLQALYSSDLSQVDASNKTVGRWGQEIFRVSDTALVRAGRRGGAVSHAIGDNSALASILGNGCNGRDRPAVTLPPTARTAPDAVSMLVHAAAAGDEDGSTGVVAGTADDAEDQLGAGDVYNLAVYAVKNGLTPATGTPACHALAPGETTSHLTTPAWCRYPGRDSVQFIAGLIPGSGWVVTQVEFGN